MIKFLRLITGEGMIAEVEQTDVYVLKNPMVFMASRDGIEVSPIPFIPKSAKNPLRLCRKVRSTLPFRVVG